MKIQCSCGAKYAIDIVPGMQPVKFVCANCGLDYSAFVNDLIRRELGGTAPAAAAPAPSAPVASPAQPSASPPPPVPSSSRLKISSAAPASAAASETPAPAVCAKHRQPAAEHCFVCKKPICPK